MSAAAIAELNRQGSATPEVALAAGGVVVGGLVLGGAFVLARRRLAR